MTTSAIVSLTLSVSLLCVVPTFSSVDGQVVDRAPSIEITVVPRRAPRGGDQEMARIAGTVSDLPDDDLLVVLFTRTDRWYVQPFRSDPYTEIVDSEWSNDTHLGAEYAALLVRPSYQPPTTTGTLPRVGGDVVASTRREGAR